MSQLEIKNGAAIQKFLGTSGTGVTGDPYFSIPFDFGLAVRRGLVFKHTIVNIIGHKYALGTAEVVVGQLDAADDIDQSGIETTPSTVKISSVDTADTSAGAGLRTLTLTGLDSSHNVISETITMNGLTEVVSSLTYHAVTGMRALTWGATTWNEGIVYCGTGTVTTGKPAVILFAIGFDPARARGGNKGLNAYYVVPAGHTFYGFHLQATVGTSNKDVQIHIQNSTNGTDWITEEVFEFESGSTVSKPINALPAQVAETHIRITAISSASATNMAVTLDGYLVQD